MNYVLIIKEPNATVKAYSNHISIKIGNSINIFSYRHLRSIFINQMATISLISCRKITKKIELFIIDTKGFVVLDIRNIKNEK